MRRSSRKATDPNENPALFKSDAEKDKLEARNGLLQFDETLRLAQESQGQWNLTSETLCHLQRLAIQDIYKCAGTYRKFEVHIEGSVHQPPPWTEVESLVADMCDYANRPEFSAVHVSAYLMWRINWIHPFGGGNGRTSRAVSYLALCTKYNTVFPGTPTIPDFIARDRGPYYAALDAADAAWRNGSVDVSAMEQLISKLLLQQLSSAGL